MFLYECSYSSNKSRQFRVVFVEGHIFYFIRYIIWTGYTSVEWEDDCECWIGNQDFAWRQLGQNWDPKKLNWVRNGRPKHYSAIFSVPFNSRGNWEIFVKNTREYYESYGWRWFWTIDRKARYNIVLSVDLDGHMYFCSFLWRLFSF